MTPTRDNTGLAHEADPGQGPAWPPQARHRRRALAACQHRVPRPDRLSHLRRRTRRTPQRPPGQAHRQGTGRPEGYCLSGARATTSRSANASSRPAASACVRRSTPSLAPDRPHPARAALRRPPRFPRRRLRSLHPAAGPGPTGWTARSRRRLPPHHSRPPALAEHELVERVRRRIEHHRDRARRRRGRLQGAVHPHHLSRPEAAGRPARARPKGSHRSARPLRPADPRRPRQRHQGPSRPNRRATLVETSISPAARYIL